MLSSCLWPVVCSLAQRSARTSSLESQVSSLAKRAAPPHAKQKKRMACRCRWGDPGQLLRRYLTKASLLGGEPLRPSDHNHTATSHVLQDGALTREGQLCFPVNPTAFGQESQTSIARSSGNAIGAIPTAFSLSSFDFSGEHRSWAPQDSSWTEEMISSVLVLFAGRLQATGLRLEVRRKTLSRTCRLCLWPVASPRGRHGFRDTQVRCWGDLAAHC